MKITRVHGRRKKRSGKQFFMTRLPDGHWLAYVRNHMVHAGASISEAIAGAFADFSRKQIPRGLSLSRYAAYSTATNKQKLPFALYCDVIDLIMAYFMKLIGYSQRIDKMSVLFNITIK